MFIYFVKSVDPSLELVVWFQSLDKETADFCIANMKPYVDMNNMEVSGTYDYVEFCNRLFQK